MTTVLVTGARGFAGRHLVESLAGGPDRVIAWGREDVDLRDGPSVSAAIAALRPDIVYHCAGAAHVGQSFTSSADTLETNIIGTHHLLAALDAARLRARVLVTSSSLVYRQSPKALTEDAPLGPATPYAVSKLGQELVALRGGTEDRQHVFIARGFNHTGPRQHSSYAAPAFARQIALIEAGRHVPELSVGNLSAARDLHDVRDTVRAYRAIIDRGEPGRPYNVCAGQAWRIEDLLERLLALSTVKVTVKIDPDRFRPNDNPIVIGSRDRIEREVGWRPSIPLDQTLSDLLDYWRGKVA